MATPGIAELYSAFLHSYRKRFQLLGIFFSCLQFAVQINTDLRCSSELGLFFSTGSRRPSVALHRGGNLRVMKCCRRDCRGQSELGGPSHSPPCGGAALSDLGQLNWLLLCEQAPAAESNSSHPVRLGLDSHQQLATINQQLLFMHFSQIQYLNRAIMTFPFAISKKIKKTNPHTMNRDVYVVNE